MLSKQKQAYQEIALIKIIADKIHQTNSNIISIEYDELFKKLNINSKEELTEIFKDLISKTITPEDINPKMFLPFCDSMEMFENYCEISISKILVPHYQELSERLLFTKLLIVRWINSLRALKLYNYLVSQEENEVTFGLEELKFFLGAENKFKLFAHFKTRVLEEIMNEFHLYTTEYYKTEIFVEYIKKTSNKETKIEVKFTKKGRL